MGICVPGLGPGSDRNLLLQKLMGSLVCVVAGKRIMGAPYSGAVERMRLLFKQQRNVVADHIRVPLVMLRRSCQVF